MRIPQLQKLQLQTFKVDFVEHIWRFPSLNQPESQAILQCWATGQIHTGHQILRPLYDGFVVELDGDYHQEYDSVESFQRDYKFSSLYNYFPNREDVLDLIGDIRLQFN